MKKIFCILSILTIMSPAMAVVDKTTVAATANYVDGAYNALNSAKQAKLTSSNVTDSGTGPIVTGVTALDGEVTVTKGQVTLPTGGYSGNSVTGQANVWIE